MSVFTRAVIEVARKELLQHIRTKRLFLIGLFFAIALVLLTIVLPIGFINIAREAGRFLTQGLDTSLENFVLLFFLSGFLFLGGYFYIQLLPIVLTADAVCSEWSNRTIFLLLSKPVSRAAFVIGKFVGSIITVALALVVLLGLDYIVLQFLLPGGSDATDVARFFAALGIMVLGVAAFSAVALFLSAITRSTATAMILAVASWIVVFPLLGQLDRIISIARFGADSFSMSRTAAGIGWSRYLSPGSSMEAASSVLVGADREVSFFGALGATPVHVGWSILALVLHTAFFLGLALVVVQRRNFE